jgi:tetratricopeptide (TPR) repeat protein
MLVAGDLVQAQSYFELAMSQAENGSISLPEYLDCLLGLNTIYCQTERFDQAESVVILALSTVQKQVGKAHYLYGLHLNNLAFVRLHQGRLKEAEYAVLESIAIIEKSFDSGHPELLKPLENLGLVYREQNQITKAVQSWERAISISQQCFAEDDPGVKLFKNLCSKTLAASRKSNAKSRTGAAGDDVQLTLFS